MNKLYVGFSRNIDLPKGSFLYIADEIPNHPKAKVFDPLKHSFDLFKDMDKKRARETAGLLYTATPGGENTLTVRNGRRALARALASGRRFDDLDVTSKIKGVKEEVEEMIDDLLFTDVMRSVLCSDDDFAFESHNRKVFARINRAELGDDDALVLGLLLMAHYKGQVICPDFGFYGREAHVSLIRQGRLIAGVNVLAELPPRLRQNMLLIGDKTASGATAEDAELLALYRGHVRGTIAFNDYVQGAMAQTDTLRPRRSSRHLYGPHSAPGGELNASPSRRAATNSRLRARVTGARRGSDEIRARRLRTDTAPSLGGSQAACGKARSSAIPTRALEGSTLADMIQFHRYHYLNVGLQT